MKNEGESQTRDIPTLAIRGSLGSVNDKRRTVDIIFSTGAAVLRNSYFDGPSYEELSMDPKHVRMGRLQNGAPFLADHRASLANVIGVVESARLESGKGIATVRFAKAEDDPEADKIYRKIRDGLITGVSVGYRTYRSEKVEGGNATIPTFRATDWEPYEISAVALPAESPETAGFRSESKQEFNPCVFVTRNRSNAMEQSEEVKVAIQQERERVSAIRSAVKAAHLADAEATRMIDDGTTADACRAFALENMARRSDSVSIEGHRSGIEVGDSDSDKFARAASAWLGQKSGNGVLKRAVAAGVDGFNKSDLDPGGFRGMSLLDVARECLERGGVRTRGMTRMELAGKALSFRAGANTPSDFPILFELSMHKQMLGSYATTPDTWSRMAGRDSVSDFRDHNRYRIGSFTSLDLVAPDAEYQNKPIPDGAKSVINVETKGNIISLSRQALVNDDLGSLADIVARLGRAAKMSIEKSFYDLLALNAGLGPTQLDGQPFLHSNRLNVATSAALTSAALDADRVKMASQKDITSNEFLDLRPAVLLVPIGLGGQARVINAAAYDNDGVHFEKPNVAHKMFGDVVDSARLTVSATRRYLFADAAIAPAIKVVFLEGSGEGPTMSSQEGFRTDGIEWKCRIDYRVIAHDPRGIITNAGI